MSPSCKTTINLPKHDYRNRLAVSRKMQQFFNDIKRFALKNKNYIIVTHCSTLRVVCIVWLPAEIYKIDVGTRSRKNIVFNIVAFSRLSVMSHFWNEKCQKCRVLGDKLLTDWLLSRGSSI